jgi:hypothetical protein
VVSKTMHVCNVNVLKGLGVFSSVVSYSLSSLGANPWCWSAGCETLLGRKHGLSDRIKPSKTGNNTLLTTAPLCLKIPNENFIESTWHFHSKSLNICFSVFLCLLMLFVLYLFFLAPGFRPHRHALRSPPDTCPSSGQCQRFAAVFPLLFILLLLLLLLPGHLCRHALRRLLHPPLGRRKFPERPPDPPPPGQGPPGGGHPGGRGGHPPLRRHRRWGDTATTFTLKQTDRKSNPEISCVMLSYVPITKADIWFEMWSIILSRTKY